MPAVPHTIDIVVSDMAKALAFYRLLGLKAEPGTEDRPQVETKGINGYSVGFVSEAMVRQHYPDWATPVGQRVTLAFACDSAAELDRLYAEVEAAGHPGDKAPWDSFWGQRYAFLRDPDGNRVDLFAEIDQA